MDFKVGDYVYYHGMGGTVPVKKLIGECGTVAVVYPYDGRLQITWDNGGPSEWLFSASNCCLVTLRDRISRALLAGKEIKL